MNRRERRASRGKIAHTRDTNEPLAVIRPKNPEVALALAKTALDNQDQKLVDSMLEAQDYTFLGWLEVGGENIIDKDGKPLGKPQPGDSFVTLKDPNLPN